MYLIARTLASSLRPLLCEHVRVVSASALIHARDEIPLGDSLQQNDTIPPD